MLKNVNDVYIFSQKSWPFQKKYLPLQRISKQTILTNLKTSTTMTKETAKIIKSISGAQKVYREQLINLVMELIDCALNRHNEPDGKIFLGQKVVLFDKKNRAGYLASMTMDVAEYIYYNREPRDIQVFGEDSDFNEICIGNFDTMPIGMVEEVVKAIIETAKSE